MQVSSINNNSPSYKARLDKKTLQKLSKEFESSKVEVASLDGILGNLDATGSRTSRLSISDVIKTTIQEGKEKFSKFHREITITNPLFGNAEYTMKVPQSEDAMSLTDTVKWMYKTGAVEKMENSLFGNMLKRLQTSQPETPAVSFLKELLPSFKQSGCSQKSINSMVNTAVEADRKALLAHSDSIVVNKTIKAFENTKERAAATGSKKEQVLRKYA